MEENPNNETETNQTENGSALLESTDFADGDTANPGALSPEPQLPDDSPEHPEMPEEFADSFPRAGEGEDSAALIEESIPEESAGAPPCEADEGFPLASVVESILFTSQKPVSAREILQILRGAASASPENPALQQLGKTKEAELRDAMAALQDSYEQTGRSFEARESAAGWQLVTKPDFAPWLRQLFPENRPARLSAPALETLAIIAYRQPITRADIEAVRGVAVDGVMQTLLDRGLVKIAGRADVPGRPLLYSTTQHFMEHFGLRDLCELPNASELRALPLPKAPVAEADATPGPAGTADRGEQSETTENSQTEPGPQVAEDPDTQSEDDNGTAPAASPDDGLGDPREERNE